MQETFIYIFSNYKRYYSTWIEKYEEVVDSTNNNISSILKSIEDKRKISHNFDHDKSKTNFKEILFKEFQII